MKLLLTPPDAAEQLSIGLTKLHELIGEGAIETVLIGRCRRVPVDALRAYVDGLVAEATADGRTSCPQLGAETSAAPSQGPARAAQTLPGG